MKSPMGRVLAILEDAHFQIMQGRWNAHKRVTEQIGKAVDILKKPNPCPTVREVFSKTYGEVPENAECYTGYTWDYEYGGYTDQPVYVSGDSWAKWDSTELKWIILDRTQKKYETPFGPDISDRPATAFRGFFGDLFDKALDEMLEEIK